MFQIKRYGEKWSLWCLQNDRYIFKSITYVLHKKVKKTLWCNCEEMCKQYAYFMLKRQVLVTSKSIYMYADNEWQYSLLLLVFWIVSYNQTYFSLIQQNIRYLFRKIENQQLFHLRPSNTALFDSNGTGQKSAAEPQKC